VTVPNSIASGGGGNRITREEVDSLFSSLYAELQFLARGIFQGQSADHTLQPTALVHEAYLKISSSPGGVVVNDREHALAIGARAMRQLLINHARGAGAVKRGGGKGSGKRLTLSGIADPSVSNAIDAIAFEEAMTELDRLDSRQRQIIECRYLAGLTAEQTARVLEVSVRTVQLETRVARLWLLARLNEGDGASDGS